MPRQHRPEEAAERKRLLARIIAKFRQFSSEAGDLEWFEQKKSFLKRFFKKHFTLDLLKDFADRVLELDEQGKLEFCQMLPPGEAKIFKRAFLPNHWELQLNYELPDVWADEL